MSTLSLCMIVKNEELTLPRVLDVAHIFADEIIIVDTGSTDNTIMLAKNANCKVYHFKWINDFSAARNYAFSLATSEYLMWLDADDVITNKRAQMLADIKKTFSADVVMLPYYMGDPPTLTFWRERIIKRTAKLRFKGRVHEAIDIKGDIVYQNIPIIHDKLKKPDLKRNLKIFDEMLSESSGLNGREAFYYGSELYYNGLNEQAAYWLEKFFAGDGLNADKGQAALYLSRIYKSTYERCKILKEGLIFVFSPDLLCELGDVFLAENRYHDAKSCYLSALSADENLTFTNPDNSKYIPHIRLCFCYWHLGDKSKAEYHNAMALKIKPNDQYALNNAKLF